MSDEQINEAKQAYEKAFQSIIALKNSLKTLKKLILEISSVIIPNCSNPLFLSDFLTVSLSFTFSLVSLLKEINRFRSVLFQVFLSFSHNLDQTILITIRICMTS